MKAILAASVFLVVTGGVLAARAEMKLPEMKKQPSVQAVLDGLTKDRQRPAARKYQPLSACDIVLSLGAHARNEK